MTDLLPCPFCGEVPDAEPKEATSQEFGTYVTDQGTKWGRVQCGNCGCWGPDVRTGYGPVEEWKPEADTEWNSRTPAQPAEDARAAARDLCRRLRLHTETPHGDDSIDVEAVIEALETFAEGRERSGANRALDEALNSGDGSYRP